MREPMIELFKALSDFEFLRNAFIAGILISISCGITGTFVTVRRVNSLAGAIAHSTFGGMGAALYLNRELGFTFLTPFIGAMAGALVSALAIALLNLSSKERQESTLNAVWAVGMATGILFISATGGYNKDLSAYLFGNILMVSQSDLLWVVVLDFLIVASTYLFFNKLQAVCFDEEFATLRGINVRLYNAFILVMIAATVVLMVQLVGIILIIALLTLPPATAGRFTQNLGKMIILSTLLTLIYTLLGLSLAYIADLPAGALIVMVAAAFYIPLTFFRNKS
jgi:zinc transport system permease protein